ncbi:dephospho-CoA kinase [Halobacillus sp. ACCC02827]|uniref:dephospho-CoA kinase n=1 Tax=Bacillaceae TaxID=186817 RepID=UPI0002A4D02C|nr:MULTISPECIES: dephospho-CoA kinase [Bacillaceae]ELK47271.1 dephospho-CoA kinase [Halobacillus sp. BAB-2008]QHT47386.1 dephospho-CoA kinase [Bacillus sp. SB49]WJE14609.1 dephospho-CoA kinase [Halobacillus sp. ACCC02827]
MTVVIGLTGSIASGKSTISAMFKELGIPVVDADVISRKVVEPGEAAYTRIVEAFGSDILLEDRTIDRKKLGGVVFSNEEKRKELNGIVHPEVRKEMVRQRECYKEEGHRAVVLDIPLLFESKLTDYVEKTLVVYVEEETQLRRLMERDQSTSEDAEARIASQIPVKKKAALADAVIDNNGSVEQSFDQLKDILQRWNIV